MWRSSKKLPKTRRPLSLATQPAGTPSPLPPSGARGLSSVGMHRDIAMRHKGSFTSKYSQGGQISQQVTVTRRREVSRKQNRTCGEPRAGNRPHHWKDGRRSREQLRPAGPVGVRLVDKGHPRPKAQHGQRDCKVKSVWDDLGVQQSFEEVSGGHRDISYDSASVHSGQRPARCGSFSPGTGQPASHSLIRQYLLSTYAIPDTVIIRDLSSGNVLVS